MLTVHESNIRQKYAFYLLAAVLLISFCMKLATLKVGAPFVTIDDNSTFQGGFMVWFGHAQPQRMYLESWLCGITSLATYAVKALAGHTAVGLNVNSVAEAYQDYYGSPDLYVYVYRAFVLVLDMITAWMVYRVGLLVLAGPWRKYAAALGAAMYLFSYNTVWCDLVARPDAIVAFFTTVGLYFYFKSDFGENRDYLWLAAIFVGLGAGLKLHAAFFAVFIALDLLRVHGFRKGIRLAVPTALVAGVCFCLAAGIPLFDPLRHLKLRMQNVKDDQSPWIHWGDQLYVIAKGSGWLVVPLVLVGAWQGLVRRPGGFRDRQSSVLFLSLCWILVFASIRQLRAYWMLPALPLFYIAYLGVLARMTNHRARSLLVTLVLGVMAAQTVQQVHSFRQVDYGSLSRWVQDNIQPDEPFYIVGYEALELPKSQICIEKTRAGLQRILDLDLANGETHVVRHLKNWEEETKLILFDMLSGRPDDGFTYYSIYGTPLDKFEGILDLDEMRYVLVQQGSDPTQAGLSDDILADQFERIVELTGPGGGGRGLHYQVYGRTKSQ